MNARPAKLIYDGACPICSGLACRLTRSNPKLELVDARLRKLLLVFTGKAPIEGQAGLSEPGGGP